MISTSGHLIPKFPEVRFHRTRIFTGESQDKEGRYRYSYYENGRQKSFYSWKLELTDKFPAGKKECVSLREQIEKLQKQQLLYGKYSESSYTVLDLVERYVGLKKGVRKSTQAGYKTVVNVLKKEEFGSRKISDIRISDAKLWLIQMQKSGRGYSSIHTIRGVLRPAFRMAVDDDVLLKNPFEFQLATIIINDSIRREAITKKQERMFLKFVKDDPHFSKYYEGIYILFKTGMRISEFCGLTIHDIDMKERTIDINHQLQRLSDMEYIIEPTKTNSGKRVLPMTQDVYECFQTILKNRKAPKKEPMVGKYVGFLYLDKNGMPMVALHWQKYFDHICEKYNKIYREQIPKITPHVCRHTYCTNMALAGMNPKTLQYLMGHSEIGVTLDVYTHTSSEDARDELEKMNIV